MIDNLIIDIDAGNSAFKWRLTDAGEILSSGRADRESFSPAIKSVLEGLPAAVRAKDIRARIVTVAGADSQAYINESLCSLGISDIAFAKVERESSDTLCGYEDLSQLGVDRWMAILAAANEFSGPMVVADFGTALTLDFVDAKKQHLGGYILPGWTLMQKALLQGTAIDSDRIPSTYTSENLSPASSTLDAIGVGRLFSLLAVVEKAVRDFSKQQGAEVLLVCTGGDASFITSHLDTNFVLRSDLVLDGLALSIG